jgi:hypothetical protein
MAVVVEAFSVIVRRDAIERRFPGGVETFERQAPNNTYCADDSLCRVAFMVDEDAKAFVRRLVTVGLKGPAEGPSPDFGIVSPRSGNLIPCEWLELEVRWHAVDGQQHGVTIAKRSGDHVGQFATPANWRPDTLRQITACELASTYELVSAERKDGAVVETHRHRQSGEVIYIGRPDLVQADNRFRELREDLVALQAMTGPQQRAAATKFLARATQLVSDTQSQDPGPLLLKGAAARLLGRPEVAEPAFRAVTVLQPTMLSAWHDLTWALASLGRLEEAESTARHTLAMSPDNSASLGNLASVLRERGKLDEAMSTAKRALELTPGDRINQAIIDQIRKDQGVPWYKRLFGS